MKAFRLAALLFALGASTAIAQGRMGASRPPATQGEVPPPKQEKVFPVGSSWIAVSLNGKTFSGERPSFTVTAPVPVAELQIVVEAGGQTYKHEFEQVAPGRPYTRTPFCDTEADRYLSADTPTCAAI